MKKLIVCGFVLVSAASLAAQWPKVTDTTVPHTADGKINYDAPTPRTADGKPDLSGIWMRANSAPPGRAADTAVVRGAGVPAAGREGAPAAAAVQQRQAAGGTASGRTRRRPNTGAGGVPAPDAAAFRPGSGNAAVPVRPERSSGRDVLRSRRQHGRRPALHEVGVRSEEGAHGRAGQGQPRRELHADGLPPVPSAAAAAQDLVSDESEIDSGRVGSELRSVAHLYGWPQASPAGRTAGVVVGLLGRPLGRRHARGRNEQPARRRRRPV